MGPQPHTYGRGRGWGPGAVFFSFRGRDGVPGIPPRPPNAPALEVAGAPAAGTPQTPQGGRCAGPLF
eukprot:gene20837-biopygen17607